MEKLTKINEEMLNKNDIKKMLKRGMQIGILGAALAAGVGCAQPTNPSKDKDKDNNTYEEDKKPDNNNNNNNNNNDNNNNGNNNNDQNNDKEYAQPYDRNLSNGYVIHNFIGQGTAFPKETVEADTNYYLGKAETYIKGMVNDLNTSVKGRNTATQNYFKKFINGLSNNNNYKVGTYSFDDAVSTNAFNSEYIFQDIIDNLGDQMHAYPFKYGFKLLASEAFKENYNYGNLSAAETDQDNSIMMLNAFVPDTDFSSEKNSSTYPKTTKMLNDLLDVAAGNMNARNGYNLTASDLRQVMNIAMTSNSLYAVHESTKTNLGHTGTCLVYTFAPSTNENYWDGVMDANIMSLPPVTTAEMSAQVSMEQGMVR